MVLLMATMVSLLTTPEKITSRLIQLLRGELLLGRVYSFSNRIVIYYSLTRSLPKRVVAPMKESMYQLLAMRIISPIMSLPLMVPILIMEYHSQVMLIIILLLIILFQRMVVQLLITVFEYLMEKITISLLIP